jgi:hypothetical protein
MNPTTRALPVRNLAAQLSRPVATRSLLPLSRSTISQRGYSISKKAKEGSLEVNGSMFTNAMLITIHRKQLKTDTKIEF